MAKKILIAVAAILIIAIVIFAVSLYKPNSGKNETSGPNQQKSNDAAKADLNKSIDAMAESLKATCADFLKGDLSGDPNSDCPGFDKSIDQSLCFYCYAIKNQNSDLCGKINNEIALRSICQKVTGLPIDNLDY